MVSYQTQSATTNPQNNQNESKNYNGLVFSTGSSKVRSPISTVTASTTQASDDDAGFRMDAHHAVAFASRAWASPCLDAAHCKTKQHGYIQSNVVPPTCKVSPIFYLETTVNILWGEDSAWAPVAGDD